MVVRVSDEKQIVRINAISGPTATAEFRPVDGLPWEYQWVYDVYQAAQV